MKSWFHHIPLFTNSELKRKQRRKVSDHIRKYGEYRFDKDTSARRPISLQMLYEPNVGKRAVINGKETKLFTIRDVAKLFKVHYSTALHWYHEGALPDAYIIRKRGPGEGPLYLLTQMRAIVRVMNDIFSQGIVVLNWNLLEDHIEMMHRGADIAVERFDSEKPEKVGKFGVEWDDDES